MVHVARILRRWNRGIEDVGCEGFQRIVSLFVEMLVRRFGLGQEEIYFERWHGTL